MVFLYISGDYVQISQSTGRFDAVIALDKLFLILSIAILSFYLNWSLARSRIFLPRFTGWFLTLVDVMALVKVVVTASRVLL